MACDKTPRKDSGKFLESGEIADDDVHEEKQFGASINNIPSSSQVHQNIVPDIQKFGCCIKQQQNELEKPNDLNL